MDCGGKRSWSRSDPSFTFSSNFRHRFEVIQRRKKRRRVSLAGAVQKYDRVSSLSQRDGIAQPGVAGATLGWRLEGNFYPERIKSNSMLQPRWGWGEILNGNTQRSDLHHNAGLMDGIPLGFREFDINPLLADRVVHFAESPSEPFERDWIHASFPRRFPGAGRFISHGTAFTGSAVFFPVNASELGEDDSCGAKSWYGGCDATQRNGNESNDGTNDRFGACLGG